MSAPDSGADVGYTADAGSGHEPPNMTRLHRLLDTQAALRRVATLVAKGAQPTEVFTAVADELGRLAGAEATFVSRIDQVPGDGGEPEERITVIGSFGAVSDKVPVGFQLKLLPGMIQTTALRTGRAARVSGERLANGPHGAWVATLGLRAGIAAPIMVGGRNWGVVVTTTSQPDFPAGSESRVTDFMELAAMAVANAKTEQDLRELADTQAALRRLATLVARGAAPEEVFAAVTREALRYFGGGTARMIRYEPDGTARALANEGATGPSLRSGDRWEGYPATGLIATVRRTGRPTRVDDYHDVPGGEQFLRAGVRSSVGLPIHVNGRLWGMIGVGSAEPLPPGSEERMTQFTDLVATAVANAQNRDALEASRDELARLLAEQAALRRVATLVAREVAAVEIFSAVAEEIRRLYGADSTGIGRFEQDGAAAVFVGGVGDIPDRLPIGTRVELPDYLDSARVWRTGRPAQVNEDVWSSASDPVANLLRELRIRSLAASPIIVEDRLWGVVNASTRRGPFPLGTADRMADFTELVGMALANAESRAEVAASRARIVTAADETRRRIERDLHDGTQQRLLALALQLRSAAVAAPPESGEFRGKIADVTAGITGVTDELREISRGIHPVILFKAGLRLALRALGRRSAVPVEMDVRIDGRLPEAVEVAAYYVVSEMLTNAARYAQASVVEVSAEVSDGALRLRVHDDGVGGADPLLGSGLVGLKDRVEALDGTFVMHSPELGGTTVCCELPVPAGAGYPEPGGG
jgi:signal transduction histidine kinase